MSKHFTHLHLHTEFSLLDGAIRIPDLMKFAQEQQWKAVGMSDHGNIFGAVKFFEEAKKHKIKPILGCEMYFTPDASVKDATDKYHHLILIVQNREGYQNLCRLMAYAYQDGFYFKPRIDYKILEKYNKGLIVSTACLGGHIPTLLRNDQDAEAEKWIKHSLDIFGRDRFFFEMMPVEADRFDVLPPDMAKQAYLNKKLVAYSSKMGVDCIVTADSHFLHHEDHEAHEILLAVQTKHLMSDPDRMTFGDFRGYVKTPEYLLGQFPDNHDAIWRTGEIADRCDFTFETGKLFFPQYPIPQNHTEASFFRELCHEGLTEIKQNDLIPREEHVTYDERLTEEVELIIKMGYIGYFLIVSDFISWAKKNNIPVGPGRGSAAGSLVAWALKITNVDPIKYNLLFERFLNPERVSMPDIDIDFCIDGREKVINYVKDKYGHDAVCQIITFGTMMAKGVIKDVARTLGFPFQDANNLTDLVPDQLKITLEECLEQEPKFKELMHSDPDIKHLMDICFKLEGLTRHASKHAAGVVISPEPLRDVLPLYIPPKTNELVTQYTMTDLESLGFLKMDFLGLTNLTVIDKALDSIEKNHQVRINLDKLPLDDKKTFDLLCLGKSSCVFQFESSGIKEVLYKLQPSRFEDLIAVNALYRPGPLGSGMVDDFIDRRHGRKKTTYSFPELEPILSETYGVIVYQEQVIRIASTIAGYSLGSADILRRAMGKKKAEVMAEQKVAFVAGAKTLKFDEKKAGELFDLMAYFAGYGFNKSHSTAYALIAYHTAYLKANYACEFMAAVLSFETSNPDKMTAYLQEAREMGITILPPDINKSDELFTASKEGILFGLRGIKNVGDAAISNIIETRQKKPFSDLYHFCLTVDLRCVNKRVIESLICAGAFDAMPGHRSQKIMELETIIGLAIDEKERSKTGQISLFSALPTAGSQSQKYAFAPLPEWTPRDKLEKEKEVIGFYLSGHPLTNFQLVLDALQPSHHKDLHTNVVEKKYTAEPIVITCGLLQTSKTITTKNGDKMAFAQVEDLSGPCEVIIFPRVYAKISAVLGQFSEFIIIGALDVAAQQQCKIKANAVIPLETVLDNGIAHAILKLKAPLTEATLTTLKEKLSPGSTPYSLQWEENGKSVQLTPRENIRLTNELLSYVRSIGIEVRLQVRIE
ncbi:MAG: polymerase subunit alpha [Candidatus Dependentiae bacterium]|nr:polymerase subunit alpha [Candidatus Dependentiae bacterium]